MTSSDRDVPSSSAISPALAAGVTGAGLATLVGGVASHRPELINGVGLIVGIDRFMSEARAVTNFAGNSVATLVIGTCTKSVDHDQVKLVLSGGHPLGGFETVRRLEAELGQAPVGQVPQ